jgi:anti-sigma factor RsiW
MSVERHDIHQESIGAFLLGALDESELRAFESHLDECPVCRDEVERLRPAVEALPRSVVQMAPPPNLKKSLMDAVEADAELEGFAPKRAPASPRSLLGRIGLRGSRAAGWAAAVLVVVAVAAGGFALGNSDDGSGNGARIVTAKLGGTMFGASASLAIPKGSSAALLRVHGMPTLKPGRTYQAWVQRGDEVIPKALFNVSQDGNGATAVDGDVSGADAVMVTREPSRGSRSPTGDPVLRFAL